MIRLGSRPMGACCSIARTKEWKEVEILAYIQNKTGDYDENECAVLSDPWLEGYMMREEGKPIDAIKLENTPIRTGVRKERFRLRLKGWSDCDEELRALKRFVAGVVTLLLITCEPVPTEQPAIDAPEYYDLTEMNVADIC